MSDTPVSRTLELLRSEGYHPEITERWVPRGIKIDLFGLVDVEALHDTHTLYVQVCRDTDLTDHLVKHLGNPRLERLIACPHRVFEIWSWAKKRNRWREQRLTAEWTPTGVVFVQHVRSTGAPPVSTETPMEVQTSAGAER